MSLVRVPDQFIKVTANVGLVRGVREELVNSFIKRRVNIKPGEPFIPFDQINAVVGGLLFLSIVYLPPPLTFITLVTLSFCLHIASNLLGYYLKLSKTKF